MSQELVKYEETIKKLDNYNVIQKWQGDTLSWSKMISLQ